MALSESQRRAQQAYRERKGGTANTQKTIGATLNPAEAERIKNAFQSVGMSNGEILRRAAARIEQGDDLRRDYDSATNSLQAATAAADGTTKE